ncbi:hypothetical protein HUT19_16820 [Streptomyces sp. NA02950]|uniref:hypothetical protein n=1 Tax=Streptomyces sp. NA02950 TaxID=2742137 RepID=UPI00158FCF2E|nr:hypothetical protein [Streptomyces sp. NA02950]QKV93215.1 hypothetical protein HUT19_16820 [Streptomyces sp. NA02950]
MLPPTTPLPPPPAPERGERADRAGLLDDRARAMGALARWYLAPHRALLLWLSAMVFALGWVLAVSGFQFLVTGQLVEHVLGVLFLGLALGATIPSSLGVATGIRRDVLVGQRLRAWARVERDPRTLPLWRVRGGALLWLLPSVVLCSLGLALGAATVFSGPSPEGFGMLTGIAAVSAAAGGLGLAKTIDYYRLVYRELTPEPTPEQGPEDH